MRCVIFSLNAAVQLGDHQFSLDLHYVSIELHREAEFSRDFKKISGDFIGTVEFILKVPPIHSRNGMGVPPMMINKS